MHIHGDGPVCNGCEVKLLDAHPQIAAWFRTKKSKYVNLHIAWSFRNQDQQRACFLGGASRVDWPNSKHNNMLDGKPCSLALDLFLIDEDGQSRWPPIFYAKIDNENSLDRLPIKWGGRFDGFKDYPHFELIFPEVTEKAA